MEYYCHRRNPGTRSPNSSSADADADDLDNLRVIEFGRRNFYLIITLYAYYACIATTTTTTIQTFPIDKFKDLKKFGWKFSLVLG